MVAQDCPEVWAARRANLFEYLTTHFTLKEDVEHGYAAKLVQEEVQKYKTSMDRNRTKYKILSEETQPDGSIVLKVIKQYNNSPVGNYLD